MDAHGRGRDTGRHHDRDVLQHVDRIIELKDKNIFSFKGNYDAYLEQNTAQTTSSVVEYQNQMKRLTEARKSGMGSTDACQKQSMESTL